MEKEDKIKIGVTWSVVFVNLVIAIVLAVVEAQREAADRIAARNGTGGMMPYENLEVISAFSGLMWGVFGISVVTALLLTYHWVHPYAIQSKQHRQYAHESSSMSSRGFDGYKETELFNSSIFFDHSKNQLYAHYLGNNQRYQDVYIDLNKPFHAHLACKTSYSNLIGFSQAFQAALAATIADVGLIVVADGNPDDNCIVMLGITFDFSDGSVQGFPLIENAMLPISETTMQNVNEACEFIDRLNQRSR